MFEGTETTVRCVRVLPEPAYVSSDVSPVVVTASLLFKGSVFTSSNNKKRLNISVGV